MNADVEAAVRSIETDLVALSHSIHAEPELAFEEFRSVAKVTELLKRSGFEVRQGVAGLPTAFDATFGSGDLVLGICAEYDALPEIGHACGHNIIAASAVGAGVALATVAERLGITVRVIGTPAEESGGGKITMLEQGIFDGVAAALMVHPGPVDITGATSLALADIAITFTGREAHASAAPEFGRNAADAATVAQVGIGLLRQHLSPGQQIHGIVSDGGTAPNIVPARAEMLYYLRAETAWALSELTARAEACFAAGALATGCTHEIRTVSPTYTELTPDPWLVATYREEILDMGRTPVPLEWEGTRPLGSTDMGNVTNVLPGIHPIIGLDSGGAVTHQPGFAAACITESADRAVVDGAIALARTAVRAATDDTQRVRLLEGVDRR
ncbi:MULTISPECIES: M20 family metallopeptidase [Rhodococcus]|uniref:Peptidase M20 domain-containing protein 2 n=1 Tax=Rhodococcus oxybenzonivorans TaxID=1990687 RepID=A0AAE5A472_9NOCA|nr:MULTISPECIES: M20 family metallopeptidase [Rhodococcus]MDV7245410.1 M20 family metallopeptidase [Rhodococcus oxybenzonivorans]MDV7263211.1 M20 family metallopeptidase [Rhodococcus oxybenzonivorans]MDV7276490.1 M20 family metallopeptidase [Rhodococcus oxybenzonivorans]MDV7336583.1 M20 family metallopeptidase [Rhodococcus oxybenzonivorans]MDV7346914.1 M20 family metallopeptidase [Rhodococcus oxybenzonivorans]